jgi:hypothetical protein
VTSTTASGTTLEGGTTDRAAAADLPDGLLRHLVRPAHGIDLILVTVLVAFALLSAAATSFPRRVGDGQEYMAMALSIARLDRPAPNPNQLVALEADLASLDGDFAAPIRHGDLVGADGLQDFPHFWMYSAMAAPFVWMASVLKLHPNWGFTALNVLLLIGSFAILAAVYSPVVGAFVVLGPVIWWVDKAHTEAFTVALLAAALAVLGTRPWWTLVLVGLASTQNIPIAVLIPITVAIAVWRNRAIVSDTRLRVGLAVGIGLSMLHPLYYLVHLGTFTSQARMGAISAGLPDPAYLAAPVIDPNIGLLPGYPLLLPALLVLSLPLGRRIRRRLPVPELAGLALAGVAWLFVFTQNGNLNHGGTPAMSRYALWLIPLFVPVIGRLAGAATRHQVMAFVLIVGLSSYVSTVQYHPGRPEWLYLTPSRIAAWIWANLPWLDNPPREIFFERTAHREVPFQAVATDSCSKVLVVSGAWPASCRMPDQMPSFCSAGQAADARENACYANRSGSGYTFARAP